jgi:group I intron endonuclease
MSIFKKREVINLEEIQIINPYGFIYITTNLINGKKYIGQKMFRISWQDYLGSGKYFLKAVKKYGKENFSREIIAIAYSKEELDKLEIEFIKKHNAVESKDYYNLAFGGESITGLHHSEETRKKMSEAQMGEKGNMYGKHHSEETKKKLSNANKNYIVSEETKKKISEATKGKKRSDNTKKKISEIQTKINSEQEVEIRYKYKTGNYSQQKLAEEYLVTQSTINNVVNFKGKHAQIA